MTTDTNFVAISGPKVDFGFAAKPSSFATCVFGEGSDKGVHGIGDAGGYLNQVFKAIGVLGHTRHGQFAGFGDGRVVVGIASGNRGIGVQGQASEGGMGVQGTSIEGGTGVLGTSTEGGTGVQGSSDTGFGLVGSGATGVYGSALGIGVGVQGASDSIGVLGGDPQGLVPTGMFVGVAGQGPSDPSGVPFSYGGWFGRGPGIQGGTAPLHLEPATAADPDPSLAAQRGDLFVDHAGRLWFCTNTGDNNPTPATWKQIQLV